MQVQVGIKPDSMGEILSMSNPENSSIYNPRSVFKFQSGDSIDKLVDLNKRWASNLAKENPGLFESNSKGQKPSIFWISCADSRYGEFCCGTLPGEVFTHRNIANLVPNCDPSSQSAIQLAMQVIGCEHIIVCGHTDCRGVKSALGTERVGGALEAWLRNLRDVRAKYAKELESIADAKERESRLAELNVFEQVYNLRANDIVREHIKIRGVQVHGFVCDVSTGHLRKLDVPADPSLRHYEVNVPDTTGEREASVEPVDAQKRMIKNIERITNLPHGDLYHKQVSVRM